jgi:hypothetical protein
MQSPANLNSSDVFRVEFSAAYSVIFDSQSLGSGAASQAGQSLKELKDLYGSDANRRVLGGKFRLEVFVLKSDDAQKNAQKNGPVIVQWLEKIRLQFDGVWLNCLSDVFNFQVPTLERLAQYCLHDLQSFLVAADKSRDSGCHVEKIKGIRLYEGESLFVDLQVDR